MWWFVTLMVITAMYALNYNRLHKNPLSLRCTDKQRLIPLNPAVMTPTY